MAIILVVLFHAWPSLLPGGFTGVDIFFVISGFLISSILLDGIENGSFSYVRFYRHRIRRLFPALFLMLATVTIAAFFILSPAALNDFAATVITTVLFLSNVEFARSSDYFSTAAELKPLLHTWSLAVEEQFYLIFPLLLAVTKRWFRSRYLAVILIGGATSFLVSLWLGLRSPAVNFFLGPSRAFELMIGAALAAKLLPAAGHRLQREALATLGLGLILVPALLLDPDRHFSGLTALPSCIGAALLIHAGTGGSARIARWLSRPLPNFIGAISYSLYLWHWPLLSLLQNLVMQQPTPTEIAATVAISFLLSALSWRLVERPILARPVDRRFLISMAVAAASLLAVSGAVLASKGAPGRFSPQTRHFFAYSSDFSPARGRCHDDPGNPVPYSQSCIFGTGPEIVAVWGDSAGAELAFVLANQLPQKRVLQATSSACPPAIGFAPETQKRCDGHNRNILAGLTHDPHVRTVVLMAHYQGHAKPSQWPAFIAGLEQAIAALRTADKRVIVVYPIPDYGFPVPDGVGLSVARGQKPTAFSEPRSTQEAQVASITSALNRITARYQATRVRPMDIFCDRQFCHPTDNGDVFYFDQFHLSLAGATRLATAIKPLL